MKTLIVGAGIGGLATGIALREAGVVVEVFEHSQELRERGAGLMTSRQATRGVQIDHPLLRAMRDTFARLLPRTLVLRMLDETLSAGPARRQN